MAKENKATIGINAKLNIDDVLKSLTEMQKVIKGTKILPTDGKVIKNFENIFSKIASYQLKAGKEFTDPSQYKDLFKTGEKILDLYDELAAEVKVLGNLSEDQLEKLIPKKVIDGFKLANKELKTYQTNIQKIDSEISKKTTKRDEARANKEKARNFKNKIFNKKGVSDLEYAAQSGKVKGLEKEYKTTSQKTGEADLSEKDFKKQQKKKLLELERQIKEEKKVLSGLASDTQKADAEKNLEEKRLAVSKLTEEIRGLEKQSKVSFTNLKNKIAETLDVDVNELGNDFNSIAESIANIKSKNLEEVKNNIEQIGESTEGATQELDKYEKGLEDNKKGVSELDKQWKEAEGLKDNIKYFFSLGNAVQLFKNAVRSSFNTVKELDKIMTETAVVTNFTVGDMWKRLPEYTERANQLGVSISGAYQSATLFYQQGLKTDEVVAVSNQTLKMARIANLDAADSTDKMTAALRGFNMEINEISAERISDVYSKLAAITASDVNEIASAMTKTASIAHSANMEFETTSAFLSQIIETTRESAETAGTALKTVIARFQELRKSPSEIGEIDGEIVDANQIEGALRTVGVSLRDSAGQFRALDDVFLELASKWDSLDTNTQRYIATIAAGSRQQSRFIAMMSNYPRTMELVNAANNSAGASQAQFEKTLASLETKLAKLKNAWDEFTMGLANSSVIKLAVDLLTGVITAINKITSILPGPISGFAKLAVVIGGMKVGEKMFDAFISKIQNVSKGVTKEEGTMSKAFSKIGTAIKNSFSNTKAFKAYQAALEAGASKGEALAGSIKKATTAKINEIIVDKKLNEEEKKAAILTALRTEKEKAGLFTRKSAITVKWANILATKAESLEAKKAAVAEGARTGATVGSTIATWGLNIAIGVLTALTWLLTLPLGVILAILLAVVVVIVAIVYAVKNLTDTAKLEKLNKKIEDMNSQLSDAKDILEDINAEKDGLEELQSKFEDLTHGTIEWKQALVDVNQKVLDLINKYPELAAYISRGAQGEMIIADEGWDKMIELGQSRYNATLNAMTALEMERSNLLSEIELKKTTDTNDKKALKQANEVALEVKRNVIFSNLAMQGSVGNSDYSEMAIEAAGGTFKDFDKQIKDAEKEIGGIGKEEKLAYSKLTGLTLDDINKKIKDEELSKDTIKTILATDVVTKKIDKAMEKTAKEFSRISTKEGSGVLKNILSTDGTKLTKKEIEEKDLIKLKTQSDVDGYLNSFGTSLEKLGVTLENFKENIENANETYELASAKLERFELSSEGLKGLGTEAVKALSGQFSMMAVGGGSEKTQSVINSFDILISELGDNAGLFSTILSGMDWKDANAWDNLIQVMKNEGIPVSSTMAEEIKKFAEEAKGAEGAISKVNIEKLKNNIESLNKIIKDIRSGEIGRILDESTYEAITKDNDLLKSSFQKDLEGNFVYLGNNIKSLEKALEDSTKVALENLRYQTGEKIEGGKALTGINYTNYEDLAGIAQKNLIIKSINAMRGKGVDLNALGVDGLTNEITGEGIKNLDSEQLEKMLSQISGLASNITGNEDFLKKESISLLTTNKLAQSSDVVAGGLISNLNNGNNEELISSINALSTMAIEYGVKGQKIDEYTTLTNKLVDAIGTSDYERIAKEVEKVTAELAELTALAREREKVMELEQQVYDAIVKEREESINQLEKINTSINDANNKLISSIEKTVAEERSLRQKEKAQEELTEKERRLAYLKMDTSGGNALEIMKLEEELAKDKESYGDTLIDQSIQELKDSNEIAQEQREEQIQLMRVQLEEAQKNGILWGEVKALLDSNEENSIKNLLMKATDFESFSEKQKEDFIAMTDDLLNAYENSKKGVTVPGPVEGGTNGKWKWYVGGQESSETYDSKEAATQALVGTGKGRYYDAQVYDSAVESATERTYGKAPIEDITLGADVIKGDLSTDLYPDEIFNRGDLDAGKSERGNVIVDGKDYYMTLQGKDDSITQMAIENGLNRVGNIIKKNGSQYLILDSSDGSPGAYKVKSGNLPTDGWTQYKTGGMADYTGPAWLDGTPSKPEAVLNATDTQNFMSLTNILSRLFGSSTPNTNTPSGDNYYDINIDVESISNDYDVDKLANKIKGIIQKDSTYRNVNTINRLR